MSEASADKRPVAAALSYDPKRASTPRVTAAGRGPVAEQILALARANKIPVHVDADLAKLLAKIEIDCEIPVEALVAVAEILAYVYRANGKMPAAKSPRGPLGPDAEGAARP